MTVAAAIGANSANAKAKHNNFFILAALLRNSAASTEEMQWAPRSDAEIISAAH